MVAQKSPSACQRNALDGEIVLWTKRTLVRYPRLSVALYEALVWRNVFSFCVLFAATVVATRLVLAVVQHVEPVPLAFLAAGTALLYSALAESVAPAADTSAESANGAAAGRPALPSDPLSKEAYRAYIKLAYSLQRLWDGVLQQRALHRAMFALQLMLVCGVLAVVLPMVHVTALVWLAVLALLLAPGVYACWIAPQSEAPQAAADAGDQRLPPAVRRNVPRFDYGSLPANFHLK